MGVNYSSMRNSAPMDYSYGGTKELGVDYAGAPQSIVPIGRMDTSTQNRLVQKESSVSLLVGDVRKVADGVIKQAEVSGGFMLQSNFSNPGEAPNASISVRIPTDNLQAYLDFLRKQSIRVVSEELVGTDITDQYKDTQARLDTLYATRDKLELIYQKAVIVQDILDVQAQLMQLQDQIDQLLGQEQYLTESAKLARVSVYLSTDELSLPYAPDSSWRPSVVFKNAIRSLIGNIREGANLLIWVGVYAVLWVPILVIIYLFRKSRMKKNLKS